MTILPFFFSFFVLSTFVCVKTNSSMTVFCVSVETTYRQAARYKVVNYYFDRTFVCDHVAAWFPGWCFLQIAVYVKIVWRKQVALECAARLSEETKWIGSFLRKYCTCIQTALFVFSPLCDQSNHSSSNSPHLPSKCMWLTRGLRSNAPSLTHSVWMLSKIEPWRCSSRRTER